MHFKVFFRSSRISIQSYLYVQHTWLLFLENTPLNRNFVKKKKNHFLYKTLVFTTNEINAKYTEICNNMFNNDA